VDGGITDSADLPNATGEGWTPSLTLDGFTGTLDHLLTVARAQQIDLLRISPVALVDQLVAALRDAPAATPLGQKADWVVMAAWLVQLRTRLLLPLEAPSQKEAVAEADQLRSGLAALEEIQALAGWLEHRPQLGHEVFARGQPEAFGISVEPGQAIDVIEFLWASMVLFDDEAGPDTVTRYRPRPFELYAVAEARERILRRLAESPAGASLEQLLPDTLEDGVTLRRRSAWSSTLVASLELAKQGDVVLEQAAVMLPIHVSPRPPTPAVVASHEAPGG
jgi:segregation and condensation protein A